MVRFFLTALFIVGADQYVKHLIRAAMRLYQSIPVIHGVFNITYIENFGIAFGLTGQGENSIKRWILCFVILAAAAMIIFYWFKYNRKKFMFDVSLGLILGGAIGNLIDRVLRGSVTDFLEVGYKNLTWPVFNVADSSVSVGVALFILYLLISKDDMADVKKEEQNAPDTV
jgi:signal peptidase II